MSRHFKHGDKVRCIKRVYTNETVGKVYTFMRYIDKNGDFLEVEKDDYGSYNRYHTHQFVLAVPDKPKTELEYYEWLAGDRDV